MTETKTYPFNAAEIGKKLYDNGWTVTKLDNHIVDKDDLRATVKLIPVGRTLNSEIFSFFEPVASFWVPFVDTKVTKGP